MASPALADVCDKERPDWDGVPVTLESEALALFLSPAGLFLLGALAVAVLFRHAMGTAIVALLWSVFISFIVWPDPTGLRGARISEGCEAQPTLFLVASAALCLAAVIYTARREKRL